MRRKYCRNKFLNRNYFTWKHSNRECEFWDSLILNCDYICMMSLSHKSWLLEFNNQFRNINFIRFCILKY
jgi:hypothetical protein